MRQHKNEYPADVHVAADGMQLHDLERLTVALSSDRRMPESKVRALAAVYKEERRRFLDMSFKFTESVTNRLKDLEGIYRDALGRMEDKGRWLLEQQHMRSVSGSAAVVSISVSLAIDCPADDWAEGSADGELDLWHLLCSGWPDGGTRSDIGYIIFRTDADGNEQECGTCRGILDSISAAADGTEPSLTGTAQPSARFEKTLSPLRGLGLAWQDLLMVEGFRMTAEIEYQNV